MLKPIADLAQAMCQYDHGDPMRIHHFLKVHDFAALIGKEEGLDDHTQFILESAALVHDIGIHVSEEKYGSSAGRYQEIEGPAEAENLLSQLNYEEQDIKRICYLVGHHHTYTNIDGMDYQILVEADFLVNLYEDHLPKSSAETVCTRIFKTSTGKTLLNQLYLLPR